MSYQLHNVGDYFTSSHISALDNATEFTWSVWVRACYREYGMILQQYDVVNTDGFQFLMSGLETGFVVIRDGDSGFDNITSMFDETDNTTWFNLFGTYDAAAPADERIKVYTNGSLVTQTGNDIIANQIGTNSEPFQIGGPYDNAHEDAWFAEVALWPGNALDSYASLIAAGDSPMAMVIQPDYYWRLKTDANATAGGLNLTINGSPTLDSGVHPTVDDPPAGGGPSYILNNKAIVVM